MINVVIQSVSKRYSSLCPLAAPLPDFGPRKTQKYPEYSGSLGEGSIEGGPEEASTESKLSFEPKKEAQSWTDIWEEGAGMLREHRPFGWVWARRTWRREQRQGLDSVHVVLWARG